MDKKPFIFQIEIEIENDITDSSARIEAEKALKAFCRIKIQCVVK